MDGIRSVVTGRTGRVAAAAVLCAAVPAWAGEDDVGRYGDLGQAFTLLIIFGGLLFLLGKYAWRPILAQLQRREKEITERLRDSERRQGEAKEMEAEYRAQLERADAEAKQVLVRSLDEAAKAREDMLAAAREEANRSIEAAKNEIERFKQAALEDLQQAMAGLAVDIASEIIREELSAEKQRKLIDKSLERIRERAAREL